MFHGEDPQTLVAPSQNLVTQLTWCLGFMHPFCILLSSLSGLWYILGFILMFLVVKWFALLDNVAVLFTGKQVCCIKCVQKEHLVLNANCQCLMSRFELRYVRERHEYLIRLMQRQMQQNYCLIFIQDRNVQSSHVIGTDEFRKVI